MRGVVGCGAKGRGFLQGHCPNKDSSSQPTSSEPNMVGAASGEDSSRYYAHNHFKHPLIYKVYAACRSECDADAATCMAESASLRHAGKHVRHIEAGGTQLEGQVGHAHIELLASHGTQRAAEQEL